jgi:hypothetical protein
MRFPHWQFFESLDDELHSLSRIIEFDNGNFATFSVLMARLYLSVGSEIDVVAKLLCARIDAAAKVRNMDDYREVITKRHPNFAALKTELPGHELEFQPWITWSHGTNPSWWKSYNDVKHERSTYYRDANLGNLLESASGLLVLLIYLHQPELYSNDQPIVPAFKILRIESRYVGIPGWGAGYSLPDFGSNHPLGARNIKPRPRAG